MKKISVIIPALNEEAYIGQAIRALQAQDFPREDFEIIVVDNNSTDATFRVATETGVDKVLKEARRGTNWARQKGFVESDGEIIAFLDADCQPPSFWLTKIWDIFEKHKKDNLGFVSGIYDYVDLCSLVRAIASICQKYGLLVGLKLLNLVFRKNGVMAWGGNMALKREALETIQGFNTNLTFWGDDADTALRIARAGYKTIFKPDLVVKSSARFLKKNGVLKVAFLYLKAYLERYFKIKHYLVK